MIRKHPHLDFNRRLVALAIGSMLSTVAMAQQEMLSSDAQSFENGTAYTNAKDACPGGITGTIANEWFENTACGSKIKYSLEVPPGGTTKAMLVDVTSGPVQFYSRFNAIGGNRYDANIKLKSNVDIEVMVRVRQDPAPWFDHDVRAVKLKANSDWQTVSLSVQHPNGQAPEPELLMISVPVGAPAFKLWVDDASVKQTASSVPKYRIGGVVPKSLFGIHQHGSVYHDINPYNMGSSVGAERFWDADGIQLDKLFPTDATGNDGNWAAFEARIKRAQDKGTDLLMELGGSLPAWASADPAGQYGKNDGCDMYWGWDKKGIGGSSGPAKDLATWKQMVDTLVAKAAGRIKYWEIWNEPYQCELLTSATPLKVDATNLTYDTSYLVKLAEIAYKSVKASKNPSGASYGLQVISPSFNASNLPPLDRYLALGGAKYQDITAVHNYCTEAYDGLNYASSPAGDQLAPPETCLGKWSITQNVRNILGRYVNGSNVKLSTLPVWDTESRVELSLSKIALAPQYVARHYLMSYLTGVDRSYYYTWDHDSDAISLASHVTSTTYQQNAVGKAYEVLSGWLVGARVKNVIESPSGRMMVAIRRPGATIDEYIIWISSGKTTPWIVPSGLTKMTNLAGVSTTVMPLATVNLNGSMVLFSQ